MYAVTVTNASSVDLTTSDGKTVNAGGGTWTSPRSGNAGFTSQHFGPIAFLDIGDTHIGGDSTETWGVLITYQGEELVGRYEGEGALDVAINQFGQATLMGMDLRQVALPGLTIGQSAVADAAQSPPQ